MVLGIVATGLVKLSVCLLYWRLFARVISRRFLMAWSVIIVCWTVAFVLAGLPECSSQLPALFSSAEVYYQYCGSAVPAVMDTRTKVLTLMTFMIGALKLTCCRSVGASIAKTYIYIVVLGTSTQDAILSLTAILVWNLVELQVGIIAACGPTLRVILSHIMPTETLTSLLSSMVGSRRRLKGSAGKSSFNGGEAPSTAESIQFPMNSFAKVPSESSGRVDHHWTESEMSIFEHYL
ncbi:hypothetical protein B0H63DRAFT_448946 [Podospora didyma]|uniref:Rhodopsin domain-containing protein n=1 Tax=Podospora didyma TaxID=330526 RepID=A0AAE0NNK8_9PEZI|nr:hypothetical protein B0H63DRAFT_448946 [Podospora didyma]